MGAVGLTPQPLYICSLQAEAILAPLKSVKELLAEPPKVSVGLYVAFWHFFSQLTLSIYSNLELVN